MVGTVSCVLYGIKNLTLKTRPVSSVLSTYFLILFCSIFISFKFAKFHRKWVCICLFVFIIRLSQFWKTELEVKCFGETLTKSIWPNRHCFILYKDWCFGVKVPNDCPNTQSVTCVVLFEAHYFPFFSCIKKPSNYL